MHYLNASDINYYGRFDGPAGSDELAAHLSGPADSVALDMVPTFSGTEELMVLVGAEGGRTCAAIRVSDLLALAAKHYPALVAQVCAAAAADVADSASSTSR